jgi:transglutaminase-like putative cysteine protease
MLTHFLFDQSLLTAGYMLVTGWATTSVLIAISHRGHAHLGPAQARQAGVLLLQGVPVMLLLFVLFPRLPGPLWGLPDDAHQGVTGMSDSMEPGSISELSRSDEVAFRVRFESTVPPARERYWRGLVLAEYDGQEWSRAPVDAAPRQLTTRGNPVRYTVTLEPHGERWLFALDMPAPDPDSGSLSFFNELRSDEPVDEARRYNVRSYTDYRLEPELSERARTSYTELPSQAHPRARELARSWRNETDNDAAVVERALAYFREQPFEYTLSPEPLRGEDRIDDFLFETRSGFCELYAGAFTVLMRAAGIPARVVIGYQGAAESANEAFWTVRQSDAHAWSEVWLPSEGWRRVDPTGAVSPERIDLGLGASVPDGDDVPDMARGGNDSWIRTARRAWDVVDATWTGWVISYGPDRQDSFLESIGLGSALRLVAVLAGAIVAFMAVLGLAVIWQQTGRRDPDPARRLWHGAQRRLSRRGLPPHAGEGPRDYAERVAREAPELAAAIREAARYYLRLRYYPNPDDDDLARLRAAVKRLGRRRHPN